MREELTHTLSLTIIALSNIILLQGITRISLLLSLLLYTVAVNIEMFSLMGRGGIEPMTLGLGTLTMIWGTLNLLGYSAKYIIALSTASLIAILGASYWDEDLVRSQYTPLYSLSIILALFYGYIINSKNISIIILASILETHIAYHINSEEIKPLLKGFQHLLAMASLYTLLYLLIGDWETVILYALTYILKTILGLSDGLRRLYPSLDVFIKASIGGIIV